MVKEFCRKLLSKKTTLHNLFLENSSSCYSENKLQKSKGRKGIYPRKEVMTKMIETEKVISGYGFKG